MNRILDRLPHGIELEHRLRTLAALDAVLSPEWQYRYYSFDTHWAPGERMGSMRDGSGNGFFALFRDGQPPLLRCYGKDCTDAPAGATDEALRPVVDEPAFSGNDGIEFFLLDEGASWRVTGTPNDYGLDMLLGVAAGGCDAYLDFAHDYYEPEELDDDAVRAAWDAPRLTGELATRIDPDVDADQLADDLAGIYG